jgi:arylsulfatase A-like enzyme
LTAIEIVDDIPQNIQPSRQDVLQRARGDKKAAARLWLDDAVGAIPKRIADLGLDEETIFLLIADNGARGKWSCYEGGVNTGCIVRWKNRIPAGKVSDALMQNVDVAPTVLDLCSVELFEKPATHGVSLAAHLLKDETSPRDAVFLEFGYQRAVIDRQNMKYLAVRYPAKLQRKVESGVPLDLRGEETAPNKAASADELYDLNEDSQERQSLTDSLEHQERLQRMRRLMAKYSQLLPHRFGEFTDFGRVHPQP